MALESSSMFAGLREAELLRAYSRPRAAANVLSPESEEFLSQWSFELRPRRKARLRSLAGAVMAVASAVMVLLLVSRRKAVRPLVPATRPDAAPRGPLQAQGPSSATNLGGDGRAPRPVELPEETQAPLSPVDLVFESLSSAPEVFFDANESFEGLSLASMQSAGASHAGSSGFPGRRSRLLQVSGESLGPMSFSLSRKPQFLLPPRFPRVSYESIREANESSLPSLSEVLKLAIGKRLGYGAAASAARPERSSDSVKAEFSFFLRELERSRGPAASQAFVTAAVRAGKGLQGRAAREEVEEILWVAFGAFRDRELMLASQLRLRESRLASLQQAEANVHHPLEGTSGVTVPSQPRLSAFGGKGLAASAQVKAAKWEVWDVQSRLKTHYETMEQMLQELQTRTPAVLLAAELSCSSAVEQVRNILRDWRGMGVMGTARLATKLPQLLYAVTQATTKAPQPWPAAEVFVSVRELIEKKLKDDHLAAASVSAVSAPPQGQAVHGALERLKVLALAQRLPDWAVAALCLEPSPDVRGQR